jgi:hypothetical protein
MTEFSASSALCRVKQGTVHAPKRIERRSRKGVPHQLALLTTGSQARQRSMGSDRIESLPLALNSPHANTYPTQNRSKTLHSTHWLYVTRSSQRGVRTHACTHVSGVPATGVLLLPPGCRT